MCSPRRLRWIIYRAGPTGSARRMAADRLSPACPGVACTALVRRGLRRGSSSSGACGCACGRCKRTGSEPRRSARTAPSRARGLLPADPGCSRRRRGEAESCLLVGPRTEPPRVRDALEPGANTVRVDEAVEEYDASSSAVASKTCAMRARSSRPRSRSSSRTAAAARSKSCARNQRRSHPASRITSGGSTNSSHELTRSTARAAPSRAAVRCVAPEASYPLGLMCLTPCTRPDFFRLATMDESNRRPRSARRRFPRRATVTELAAETGYRPDSVACPPSTACHRPWRRV